MNQSVKNNANFDISFAYYERIKIFFISCAFFFVIGAYTLIKELKDSVFVHTVGTEYLPLVKPISIVFLIPLVLIYSTLVDALRRYQLLYVYTAIYGIIGLVCVFFLGHPTIGILNTNTGPHRLFGWFFYLFVEGYVPFVVSLMWAFVNSISTPDAVKNNYIVITACSKAGGMLTAGFAWWFLRMYTGANAYLSDAASYQVLLTVSSMLLLCVPFVIFLLMRMVPKRYFHGYEAAYQVEKKRERQEKKESHGFVSWLFGIWRGLALLIRYPYVLGIFGMIFFWEIINVVFNFLRLSIGQAETKGAAEFGVFLYEQAMFSHIIGLCIVLVGTGTVIRLVGERWSLILVPVLTGSVIGYYLTIQTALAAKIAYVIMRAINFAFAYPLRESLYIPTTKAMKFKSKSWIDSFGAKFSKSVGSTYTAAVSGIAKAAAFQVHVVFFAFLIALWTIMAHFLGRRFEKAVENDEVVGVED